MAHHENGADDLSVIRGLLSPNHNHQGRRQEREPPRRAHLWLPDALSQRLYQPHHLRHHEQAVSTGVQERADVQGAAVSLDARSWRELARR